MLPFRIVYSEAYQLNLGPHVFPAQKYRFIYERLLAEGLAEPSDFLAPPEAADEDVLLVHTHDWVRKLRTGTLSYGEVARLEVPYSEQLVSAFWRSAGGSILACRQALERGAAMNLCGGFHHAFPDYGEGFCAINDVAIAVRRLQKDGRLRRALIVDCDVHQGNGTAAIFAGDPDVFTFSMHQENNYPTPKPPSTLDINLPDGIGDAEYLELLKGGLEQALGSFTPDLVCYLGGADPYENDQLGGLALTVQGLQRRDELVLATSRRRGLPVMATLAGGYARRVADTVLIHTNTVLALKVACSAPARGPEDTATGEQPWLS